METRIPFAFTIVIFVLLYRLAEQGNAGEENISFFFLPILMYFTFLRNLDPLLCHGNVADIIWRKEEQFCIRFKKKTILKQQEKEKSEELTLVFGSRKHENGK